MGADTITVNDRMQSGYRYRRVEPAGMNFHPEFKPELTPAELLSMGVFGGKYMTDCREEFPADWFKNAKLNPRRHDPKLNFFGVNASKPLSYWKEKGTAATTWGGAAKTTPGRSAAGKPSPATSAKSAKIA